MTERIYIVLAKDAQTKDTIVFGVRAETPTIARGRIEKFYIEQDWEAPVDIHIAAFRTNTPDPVLFVGHAHHEYAALEEQIQRLTGQLELLRSEP